MSIQEEARLHIIRNRHAIANRQRSLLSRAATNVGMPSECADIGRIQGKPRHDAESAYGRSSAAMS